MSRKHPGRFHIAIPGPTNIPERILNAMHISSEDQRNPEIPALTIPLYKDVKKVFHSCKEDLEAVFSWAGHNLVNIFDTQLANAFLGGSYSIGYQDLVIDKIDVKVDKDETRSNWLRRPLSDSQLRYAASDVEFLSDLYIELEERLISEKKIDWFQEEVSSIVDSKLFSEPDSRNLNQTLSKINQRNFLEEFNSIVESSALEEDINRTLLFSKKSQKTFLYKILNSNLETAAYDLTEWRKNLLLDSLKEIIHHHHSYHFLHC